MHTNTAQQHPHYPRQEVLTSTKNEGSKEKVQLVPQAHFRLSRPVWARSLILQHVGSSPSPTSPEGSSWGIVAGGVWALREAARISLLYKEITGHTLQRDSRTFPEMVTIKSDVPFSSGGRRWCHLYFEMPVLRDVCVQGLNEQRKVERWWCDVLLAGRFGD